MIQKGTFLIPMDRCGVWWVSVFHVYKGFYHKIGKVGNFVKVSVKNTRPNNWVMKKSKLNSIFVLSKKQINLIDNSYFKFKFNSSILLKKRLNTKGKEIIGPGIKVLKRKKFLISFSGVL